DVRKPHRHGLCESKTKVVTVLKVRLLAYQLERQHGDRTLAFTGRRRGSVRYSDRVTRTFQDLAISRVTANRSELGVGRPPCKPLVAVLFSLSEPLECFIRSARCNKTHRNKIRLNKAALFCFKKFLKDRVDRLSVPLSHPG